MPLFGRNPFRLRQASEAEPDTALIGSIVMWAGSNIPAGWVLCDGTNGTPDMRGCFIAGVGNGVTEGAFGSDSANASHTHSIPDQSLGSSSNVLRSCRPPTSSISTSRRNATHSHTLYSRTTTAQTNTTIATVPSYLALAFIQRR